MEQELSRIERLYDTVAVEHYFNRNRRGCLTAKLERRKECHSHVSEF